MATRPGRKLGTINYANLNKRGFMSARPARTRKRITKNHSKSNPLNQFPHSLTPQQIVFSEGDESDTWEVTKDWLKKVNRSFNDKGSVEVLNEAVNNNKSVKQTAKKKKNKGTMEVNGNERGVNFNHVDTRCTPLRNNEGANALPGNAGLNSQVDTDKDILITAMSQLNLAGLSKEEKKSALRAAIAKLEEQEEDEELQQLMAKHQQLTQRLSTPETSGNKKKNSKRLQVSKGECEVGGGWKQGELDEFTKGKLPDISEIQDLLHISEKRTKKDMRGKKRSRGKENLWRHRRASSSSESSESSGSESASASEDSSSEEERRKPLKKGKVKSGLYARAGNACLKSSELFAHSAIDDGLGDRDLYSLSFNLFVAGELEIILDKNVEDIERNMRLEVLKKLCYKHEHLSKTETLRLYANFMEKIEKGKFKWGSKSDLRRV